MSTNLTAAENLAQAICQVTRKARSEEGLARRLSRSEAELCNREVKVCIHDSKAQRS